MEGLMGKERALHIEQKKKAGVNAKPNTEGDFLWLVGTYLA